MNNRLNNTTDYDIIIIQYALLKWTISYKLMTVVITLLFIRNENRMKMKI